MRLVYLDSSAVLKLFMQEPFSEDVEAAVRSPDTACVTSEITYAEVCGFLSRALASGRITPAEQKTCKESFAAWFHQVARAGASGVRIRRAGELAVRQNLRGVDALHLVSALETVGCLAQEHRIFACFDKRLTEEAMKTGMFDELVSDQA